MWKKCEKSVKKVWEEVWKKVWKKCEQKGSFQKHGEQAEKNIFQTPDSKVSKKRRFIFVASTYNVIWCVLLSIFVFLFLHFLLFFFVCFFFYTFFLVAFVFFFYIFFAVAFFVSHCFHTFFWVGFVFFFFFIFEISSRSLQKNHNAMQVNATTLVLLHFSLLATSIYRIFRHSNTI